MQKRPERELARALYESGKTYKEIVEITGASKATVSMWCGDLAEARRAIKQKKSTEKQKKAKAEKQQRELLKKQQEVGKPAEFPFREYHLYVYKSEDHVARVQLVNRLTKQHLLMSRARYVMAVAIGRVLTRDEIVRHRNGDNTDDSIENLVIVRKGEYFTTRNREKNCVMCDEVFIPKRSSVETCSKECRYALVSLVLLDRGKNSNA